jgi:cytosine deaminase
MRETLEQKQERVEGIRPDIERLKQRLADLGELEGESSFMREAVLEACQAALDGNYGIGAVVVKDSGIIARGKNGLMETNNPLRHISHAEMMALYDMHTTHPHLNGENLAGVTMYTTLEPCPMCTVGMFNAGIRNSKVGSIDKWAGQLISHPDKMPPLWPDLLKKSRTVHELARVPNEIAESAERIFMITKDVIDRSLAE